MSAMHACEMTFLGFCYSQGITIATFNEGFLLCKVPITQYACLNRKQTLSTYSYDCAFIPFKIQQKSV
jgi:hypothetical protein